MKDRTDQIKGFAAGVGLMYLLDPDRGARRRALVRDQLVHLNRKLEDGVDAAARDARNRSRGIAARARRRLQHDHAPDQVVRERVRSRLGRVCSHPGSIEVSVQDGLVTLTGPVLAAEVDQILAQTRSTRGVRGIVNQLHAHPTGEGVPGLQGHGARPGARPELLQENWTPALRLLVGSVGATALAGGLRNGGISGVAATIAGGAMLARAATNLPTRRVVGLRSGRRTVTLQKGINIDAPVDRVWDVWTRFENLPRFMAHLEEVHATGDGRSHWVARGPAGTRFDWDAEVTRWEPHREIAWKSVEGATVANSGVVRFEPTPDGGTHIDVRLSYSPPAGAVGHAIASLLGSDPKRAMDDDLVRLKSLLEEGKASAEGETVTLEALETP